jgi:hypothetical protein
MDEFRLEVVQYENENGTGDEVVYFINGRDLISIVREVEIPLAHPDYIPSNVGAYMGLSTEETRKMRHILLGNTKSGTWVGDRIPVLKCSCGEIGCWPFLVHINADGDQVVWDSFMQPHRSEHKPPIWNYESLQPFHFDRRQYEAELNRILEASEDQE